MTVKVTIEYVQEGDTLARRFLTIDRSESDQGKNDHDEVYNYDVKLAGGRFQRSSVLAHRYGDDILTLVSEAIDSLGGRGGAKEMRR